jgi:hypothetical protein
VAAYPAAEAVDGVLVLATGDLNLTFKRDDEQCDVACAE